MERVAEPGWIRASCLLCPHNLLPVTHPALPTWDLLLHIRRPERCAKACKGGEISPPPTSALLPLHEGATLEVQRLDTFPQDSAAKSQFSVLCDRAEVKATEYGCQFSFLMSR